MVISSFRIKAVSIHFACSVLIIGLVSLLSLVLWFPYPYYEIDGTLKALMLIFCVDVIIGPLITLVISNNKKPLKELILDFSLVLLLQLTALGYGISEIYKQRVVALVLLQGELHLVVSADIPKGEPEKPDLPVFKGVYYGEKSFNDYEGMSDDEIYRAMYSPSSYRPLTINSLTLYPTLRSRVPPDLLAKYGDEAIYTIIAGKNKNGIAVINQDLEIIDIGVVEG